MGMKNERVGYSFWGYLGDTKKDLFGNELSTPDGNAFYSWAVYHGLQSIGYDVVTMMPVRDTELSDRSFNWCEFKRFDILSKMIYNKNNLDIKRFWQINAINVDFIIHEWRMPIKGRNTVDVSLTEAFQPDYFYQMLLIQFCMENQIKLVVFDLDYKLGEFEIEVGKLSGLYKAGLLRIIELGNKWSQSKYSEISQKVYIPFGFAELMHAFKINDVQMSNDLVYIGNRYERDWCIDKYIPESGINCKVYGNWLEGGRDSSERWKSITFGKRVQSSEMYDIYYHSVATILFAKEEYCKYGFMTARVVEALFYGCVPLFIEEYGAKVIEDFAGKYAELLTVRNKEDVVNKIQEIKDKRTDIIWNLRMNVCKKVDSLKFALDVKDVVERVVPSVNV